MAALTRKQVEAIVIDAIQAVNIDALTIEEEDEIADLVSKGLMDEAPELVEDEEEDSEAEDA
jgi:hypothetical protein